MHMTASIEEGNLNTGINKAKTREGFGGQVDTAKTFEELNAIRGEIHEKYAGKGLALAVFERDMRILGEGLIRISREQMKAATTVGEVDTIRAKALESFGNDIPLLNEEEGLLKEKGSSLNQWTKFYKDELEQKNKPQ